MAVTVPTLMRDAFRSARGALLEVPWVRELRRRAYRSQFAAGAPGCFYGVYASFAEALQDVPKGRAVGYDQPAMAAMYRDRMSRVYPADYPVLYWLARCLPGARRLFDFGGHVGIQYYSYRRYLDHPAGMRWVVCDVPEVVRAGRRIAAEEARTDVAFVERLDEASGADILLAAGSLQYLEASFFHTALAGLAARPRHVLVNKLPVHAARQFVTLQDTGPACHPYTVFESGPFVSAICALGYELVDRWENAELSCRVPFHPDHDVPAYSGFYFRAMG
jgi:putative methyltransferase (TIGR04325 family)